MTKAELEDGVLTLVVGQGIRGRGMRSLGKMRIWSDICTTGLLNSNGVQPMRAQDLMSHPAITCHVNDDLNVPAKLMWEHDCGTIAVVRDDGKLAGMITDRDICMAAYTQGRPLGEIPVNAVMAKHVISANPDQKLGEVEELMAENRVRRIPIIDSDRMPVGVLSVNDLAIESVQPDTRMKNGPSKIAHMLATICQHRGQKRKAA